ncbi:hypothetical protein V8E53_004790 [Lactarius tabidus]
MYLTETEKQDTGVTESWNGDTDGILVFVTRAFEGLASSEPTVGAHAQEWTLTALHEDKAIGFVASILPGFFDSHAVTDPASTTLPLMSDRLTADSILGSRLHGLRETCIPGASSLIKEQCKRRLRVCANSCRVAEVHPISRVRRSPHHPASASFPSRQSRNDSSSSDGRGPCFAFHGTSFRAFVVKKLSADIILTPCSNQQRHARLPIGYHWHREPRGDAFVSAWRHRTCKHSFPHVGRC